MVCFEQSDNATNNAAILRILAELQKSFQFHGLEGAWVMEIAS